MDSRVINTHCSPELETMTVLCRPFYLPRELTVVLVTAVYVPPGANVSTAVSQLRELISRQQKAHPEGAFIVAGDFNQDCLKSVLPKFVQYVQGPTRGKNTLDRLYSNLKKAYRTIPLPHLGRSDHISLLSVPAYIENLLPQEENKTSQKNCTNLARGSTQPALRTAFTTPNGLFLINWS